MSNQQLKRRKSEKISRELAADLSKWVSKQPTKEDAKDALGISINTLDRVISMRTGSPDTIAKIKNVLNAQSA